MSQPIRSLLMIAACAAIVPTANAATISIFTGGDSGEGIDFSGNIIHAINLSGAGNNSAAPDLVVSGVTFRDDYSGGNLVGGVTVAHDGIDNWDARPNYGASTSDQNLAEIMWDAAHGAGSGPRYPTVTFSGLLPNQAYSLQALVSENSPYSRAGSYALYSGLNESSGILQDSALNIDIRSLTTYAGAAPSTGVVVTLSGFSDAAGNLFFHVPDGTAPGYDPNGVVQAVILTQVPEASSAMLGLCGLLALVIRRRA